MTRGRALRSAVTVIGAMASLSCTGSDGDATGFASSVEAVPVPAPRGASLYTLTQGPAGTTLSWVEGEDVDRALRFSSWREGGGWSAPRTARRAEGWFLNWADRPSVLALDGGRLAAHWLVNAQGRESHEYAYGIEVAFSSEDGGPWATRLRAGLDDPGPSEYSGFLSFLESRGELFAAYLTPPQSGEAAPDPGHRMTLRLARFGSDGRVQEERVLDANVCSCCPLDLAETAEGPVIVYRDRTAGEIRDIAVTRYARGAWSEPIPVHEDGWNIDGCPTNGPVIDARGERLAVAWFTGADGAPEVRTAFSEDAGRSFGPALRVSPGRAIGYPGVEWLSAEEAAVSWVEARDDGEAQIRVRTLKRDGTAGPVFDVARTEIGRDSGMPALASVDGGLLLVWRSQDTLRSAVLRTKQE